MCRPKVEARTVGDARDVAVADGTPERGRRIASLQLVDRHTVDPVVQDDGALAPRQEFELAIAIALQEMRHVGSVALSDLAGSDAFGTAALHDRRVDGLHFR